MRWNQIQRSWLHLRPMAKRHWLELTEAQLDAINGNRELLAEILQMNYGLPRDAADRQIDDWCLTFGDDEEHATRPAETAARAQAT
jgi:hypothetical protein